jgi:hypothetical protein
MRAALTGRSGVPTSTLEDSQSLLVSAVQILLGYLGFES